MHKISINIGSKAYDVHKEQKDEFVFEYVKLT